MSGTEVRTVSDVLVEYDELETPQSSTTPINRHKPRYFRNSLFSFAYAAGLQVGSIFLSGFETVSDEEVVSMVDVLQNVMDFMALLAVFIGIASLVAWVVNS